MAFTSGKKCVETYQPIDLTPYIGRRTANPFPFDMRYVHRFCEVCDELMQIRIVEDPYRPSLGMLIQRCDKHNAFIWCNPRSVTYAGTSVPVIASQALPPSAITVTPSDEEVVSNHCARAGGGVNDGGNSPVVGMSKNMFVCCWGVVVFLLVAILFK